MIEIINPPEEDPINFPYHYNQGKFEAIDVITDWTNGLNSIEAFDVGNALKYLARWKHKNGVEDLKKARWYLDHLIGILEPKKEYLLSKEE